MQTGEQSAFFFFFFHNLFCKNAKGRRGFSRKAREADTPLGPVPLSVLTLSLQTFGVTARACVLSLGKNTSCFVV